MAFEAFVDGVKVGEAEDHTHGNGGAKTLTITTTMATESKNSAGHTLVLLAEELGYVPRHATVPP